MWGTIRLRFIESLLAASFFIVLFPFFARALSLSPSVVDVGVLPGQSATAQFSFQNTGFTEKKYTLDLLGVQLGPGETDRSFFILPDEQKSWFFLEEEKIILAGGASRTVSVHVHPPASISPQVFVVGVRMVEESQPNEGVAVHEGAIELVFVTIGEGLKTDLSLVAFDYPSSIDWYFPQRMGVILQNKGESVAVPTGSVAVKSLIGTSAVSYPLNPEAKRVPPGQTRTWFVETPLRSWLGAYDVTLQGGDGSPIGDTHRILIISPWAVGGILGGAILCVVALAYRRKRQQK